jgi:Protein of unknown function (DUF1588)
MLKGSSARRMVSRSAVGATLLAAAAVLSGAGCNSSSSSDDCTATRTYFEQSVWSPFMSTKCAKCHTPDGPAVVTSHARFVIQPASYPGFIDTNLETLKEVSKIEYEGKSELLLKPLGQMQHGGGAVLEESSDEYKALVELVDRISTTDSCTSPSKAVVGNVTMMDPPSTLRKASLALASRLPTTEETDAVTKGGEAAIDPALDTLMKDPVFLTRLREIWNDFLLTDRALAYGGAAIDFMNENDYPNRNNFDDKNPDRYVTNTAIAREPLDLLAYIVKNDKPFTDVVKADYTVVNPYSAQLYNVTDVKFADPKDANELHETHITTALGVAIPHAGMLSTPSFLNRWQTTATNRNRARARRVFQFFLATDVLKIAERPVDATTVTAEENPTRQSALCTVCHQVIDPIAGSFRGWGEQDYEHFDPMGKWHDEMFPAGFAGTDLPPSSYSKGLSWLGGQIAGDPRFALSAVYNVYKGFTGHDPLPYPRDATLPTFSEQLAGWEAQDAFFRQTAEAFSKGGFNLKIIVKAVLKSPYFRGINGDMTRSVESKDIGTARLLTPEMLNRKIPAVLGLHWRKQYDWDRDRDFISEDYNLIYGGINSDSVTSRLAAPNGIVASVAARMANELACHATAWDFTKATKDRRLFPLVQLTEVPESAGNTVDGSVTDIKKNIQYLHQLVLGEKLELDDPEITRTYQLFLDTWRELSLDGNTDLTWECSGRWNKIDGTELPDDVKITDDKTYSIRSWMAVMTYLLSDYKFLYE